MSPRPPPPRTVRARAAALGAVLACLVAPGVAPADDRVPATAATRATGALVTVAAGPRASLLPGEDLVGLARRLGLAFDGLVAANPGLDPFSPDVPTVVVPARRLVPPGPREGIVVNLPELTLYRFDERGGVRTYPIGAGRVGDALLLEAHRPFAPDGRDGGAPLRERFDALRAELRARGASVAAFDAALGRLHAEGRPFTGLVAELPLGD